MDNVGFESDRFLLLAFQLFRHEGFDLGLSELLATWKLVDASELGIIVNPETLKPLLRLIWCSSQAEMRRFEVIWKQLYSLIDGTDIRKEEKIGFNLSLSQENINSTSENELSGQEKIEIRIDNSQITDKIEAESLKVEINRSKTILLGGKPISEEGNSQIETISENTFEVLPLQPIINHQQREFSEIREYTPVSRRMMVYALRYLRRPVANGPLDVLDLPRTIEQFTHYGFLYTPVYRGRETNSAHLMLLLDQGGSMAPFHHLLRDLTETVNYESNLKQVDIYYFHNSPAKHLYLDSKLTQPITLKDALTQCTHTTSVLIVSDGGAARGLRRIERIRSTAHFIFRIRLQTELLAWLNPIPEIRWENTSAKVISHLVPMYAMHQDGLSSAIDKLRGQFSQTR